MDSFNCDLHIHSPHSIAVSKSLNLDTMRETCLKKGLHILGTGDVLQPDWLRYLENNLKRNNDKSYYYKGISFILQTEIEDNDSIHHIILFPDFDSVKVTQNKLKNYSKNIFNEWGGRPRVDLSPAELVDVITDQGGLIGPAHAFTPFKAIFRQKKYKTLEDCYQTVVKKVIFLELGLSANTDLADRLETLKNITFLSNSDAHSQDPRSLGREFNKLDMDNPSFAEVELALKRKNGRKVTLNVGLHPKLGKYYNMFCSKCRRRLFFKKGKKAISGILSNYKITDNAIIFFSADPLMSRKEFIHQVAKEKVNCLACKEEFNKNFKIKLGVSERIDTIASYDKPKHPDHRPKYINAIPLIDIIRSVRGVKSINSKTVLNQYNQIIEKFGTEFSILIDLPISELEEFDKEIASVISAFRCDEIRYTPGGGGVYGKIKLDI
ncbi:MAG: endonuclease Q family protein [Candidatus Hodarchaeota archaeon]